MTATTYAQPMTRAARTRRAPLRRLTMIELRKMADTRAGIALLGITALIAVVMMFVLAFATKTSDRNLSTIFRSMLMPVGLLIPVLGILAATSEWSQRTALTTFTLVPQRERVAAAKACAVSLLAVIETVICLGTAVIATALAASRGHGVETWNLTGQVLGAGFLSMLVPMLIGLAFGFAVLNSPLAIVLYFVLPTVLQILGGTIHALEKPLRWFDSSALSRLTDDHVTGHDWAQFGVTVLIWLVVPMVFGLTRLMRQEVK
jgi:ABC-2 type transport system permease protein